MSRMGCGLRKSLVLVGVLALVVPLLLVVFAAPVSAAGTIRVDGDAAGCVGTSGQVNPYGVVYCKIKDAVTDASSGDTIHVYPRTGVYNESVNLSAMDPDGDLTLITVNASGVPTPSTVTVDFSGIGAEFYTEFPGLDGDLTIDGFVVHSAYPGIQVAVDGGLGGDRNVVIRNVTATETESDGIQVSADGNVTISNCIASDNDQSGIHVARAGGDVVITDCTANNNTCLAASAVGMPQCQAHGIAVVAVAGQVKISDSTANGNGGAGIFVSPWLLGSEEVDVASATTPDKVTITDATTNGNGQDGVYVGGCDYAPVGMLPIVDGGDVIIENCTANGNGQSGFDPGRILGTLSIEACIARDNEHGVDLDCVGEAESVLVNGSIICGNECGVYLGGGDSLGVNGAGMNLEGNWWGCAGGPGAEGGGCDPICQEDSIAVDFTPWISKISASATVDPATVGQPTVVKFQFYGGPPMVYLGSGPGDLRGPAPFTVTTNNGTLNGNGATVQEFINAANGTLKVTLVPAREGMATVTVSGPCALGDLEGATAVLGVSAEFVPEPGSVILLGSGLMGLAGYAGLRLRKR